MVKPHEERDRNGSHQMLGRCHSHPNITFATRICIGKLQNHLSHSLVIRTVAQHLIRGFPGHTVSWSIRQRFSTKAIVSLAAVTGDVDEDEDDDFLVRGIQLHN